MSSISKRICDTILFFLLLTFASFLIVMVAPGDPVRNILGVEDLVASQEQIDELREDMGLNDPIYVQYSRWLWKILHLNMGTSVMTKRDVFTEIIRAFPATLILTISSLFVTFLISMPLGTLSAFYKGRWIDRLTNGYCMVATSIPGFWLGLILIGLFAVKLRLLPAMGIGSLNHLVLPSVTLGISMSPPYIRLLRASLIESKQKDFVRAARARGIGEKNIFIFHILRDSLIPVVTVFGVSLGSLLGGTVVTEVIFGYPGLGKLAVDAILKRDYALIQGFVLMVGVMVYLINFTLDRTYRWINPAIGIKESDQK